MLINDDPVTTRWSLQCKRKEFLCFSSSFADLIFFLAFAFTQNLCNHFVYNISNYFAFLLSVAKIDVKNSRNTCQQTSV